MFAKMMNLFAAPTALKGLLVAAALGASPAAVMAHDHDYRVDLGFRGGHPRVEIVDVAPQPTVYEDRPVQVWVEPTYQTVADRQWVAPEYRTVVDRVWVPARFEDRNVERWAYGHRVVEHRRVLVQDGHFEDVTREELVTEGHWQDVQRQELVTPGHYETRIEHVAVTPQ